jgi:hypothetical protein
VLSIGSNRPGRIAEVRLSNIPGLSRMVEEAHEIVDNSVE